MNMVKSKANSVLFFLILGFAAVHVQAAVDEKSHFAENSGPAVPDHSLAAQYLSGCGQARPEAAGDLMDPDKDRTLKELLAGIAGNVAGIYGGLVLGIRLSSDYHDDYLTPFLGGIAGSLSGSALGVCFAGNAGKMRGNFGSAFLGSSLGLLAAFAVTMCVNNALDDGSGVLAMLTFAILPPIGSVIVFNTSLRPRSLPTGSAFLNWSGGKLGLGIPDINIRPLPAYGKNMKTEFGFKINMLSVEL
jgi:hypothetical protein